jgi:hypothetical protein
VDDSVVVVCDVRDRLRVVRSRRSPRMTVSRSATSPGS